MNTKTNSPTPTVETFAIRAQAFGYAVRDESGNIILTGGEYATPDEAAAAANAMCPGLSLARSKAR
jgi:hypothetical protein